MKRFVGVAVAALVILAPVGVAQADESPSPGPSSSPSGSRSPSAPESESGSASPGPGTSSPSETPPPSTPTPSTPTPSTPSPSTTTPTQPATPRPTSAVASPAAAWSITLNQPAASYEDKPTVFTGKISQPITGSYITLWQRVPGAWVLRASTRTTTGGAYRFSYVAPYTGTWAFRTMIGVKAETALAISDYRNVTIQDRKILINTPAPWYATLTGVSVTGRMVPAEPGKELALQEYLGSGKWRLVTIGKMDAAGNFRLRVPDDLPATRTVRVVTRYVTQPAMEYSGLAKIVVKAALNPKVYAVSAAMVPYTYRAGCPVKPSSLRLLQMNYWGFDGRVHRGELIVRDAAVSKLITAWTSTFAAKFPIRQMRRVDRFGGSDIKSMAADNTSAFNCRRVTGDPYSLSPHSYGWALDINTVENPYLAANGVWYPSNGASYRNRSVARPGMLFSTSTPTKALIGQGYFWGARWSKPDYQHFQPK